MRTTISDVAIGLAVIDGLIKEDMAMCNLRLDPTLDCTNQANLQTPLEAVFIFSYAITHAQ